MTPSAAPESTARPRAAARPARVFAQGRFETLTLLRNGEQLLVSVVLPAMALVGLTLSPYPALGDAHRIDVTAPGVLALAVASTAFTGQAISTAFDRRYGVLRMYGVSPLGRSGLLMGKLIAVGAVLLVQVLLLGGLTLALGWRPHLVGIPAALVAGVLGTTAFLGLGLLIAGTLRAEAVLALANLAWVLFLGLGLLLPVATLPTWAEPLASALPSGALGEAMRGALAHGTWSWGALGVLLAWSAACWALAGRLFRWAP